MDKANCRSFYWYVDGNGTPSRLGTGNSRKSKRMISDLGEIIRRHIAIPHDEILDYADMYTGKRRAIWTK